MEAIFGPLWLPCLICFIVGIIFLVIELCLPGFGVAGCAGILCCGAVIVMQFMTTTPLVATIVSFVMLSIIAFLVIMFIRSISNGRLFRSPIVLKDRIEEDASSVGRVPEELIGKTGVVLTTLRPAGTVLIDGKRYPAKTQAAFVEKGVTVTVVASDGLDWIVE